MHILAISGSLRAASSNTAILHAMGELATAANLRVTQYTALADLPAFNPDIEEQMLPPVHHWRQHLRDANALVISSPEYIHGVPGALKNAIDWVVGSNELMGKPVLLLSSANRATYVRESLAEILRTAGTRLVRGHAITAHLPNNKVTARDILADADLTDVLRAGLHELQTLAAASPLTP